MIDKIEKSLSKLIEYCEKEEYKGYDPYDTLNSPILYRLPGNYSKFVILQLQKRNPINIRGMLGIGKEYVHKGMALFLKSYSTLYQLVDTGKLDDFAIEISTSQLLAKANYFYNWLLSNSTEGYDGLCWAVTFPIARKNSIRPKIDPSSVLACFVAEAMFEYYKINPSKEIIDKLEQIARFIEINIPFIETDKGICYSYTTRKQDIVFNANMHVAQFFSQFYALTNNIKYFELAKKCVEFTISYQEEDGKWAYSINASGIKKYQSDFHQGFIIDSLSEYIRLTGDNDRNKKIALDKAVSFYKTKIFRTNGSSYWRFPQKWPIDIHNQSQGIITFTNQNSENVDYLKFASKITQWTIENMQDKKGYFYYQKWPIITNKIPYIRWSQAWMMLALTTILNEIKRDDNNV